MQVGNLLLFRDPLHEAVDFILGVGQTILYLLRGQIIGGLKTNGLRALQHEFRAAARLSNLGYDITFFDLEGYGNFDLLAVRDGLEYELEAKSVPIFSGRSISPEKAERFFDEARKGFGGWTDATRIPVLDVILNSGLPTNRQQILSILERCNYCARTQSDQSVDANSYVRFVGTIPDAPHEQLAVAARQDWIKNGVIAFVPTRSPKVIIRLRSEKKDKFIRNILSTISESCKTQLSTVRPSAIWVHIEFISTESFRALLDSVTGSSQLDSIANAAFDSSTRNHVVQLVFSGGAYLHKNGSNARSSFASKSYNNPNSKFGNISVFPNGTTRRPISSESHKRQT